MEVEDEAAEAEALTEEAEAEEKGTAAAEEGTAAAEAEEGSAAAEAEEGSDAAAAEGASTDSRTTAPRSMSSAWESSCIRVKMTLCAGVQQRKTKFPTSMPRCTWKTRSRLGRWMRFSASSGTFIFQSNCQII